ncbi:zinc finger protein 831 [Bombina bombina]|uniref:zinc finger protein 831 n=1 Tax=Bombina bombina TaxID=8345 RepID=UPI00235A7139|nr:zinc finger protein 831 [Bombina bombina]
METSRAAVLSSEFTWPSSHSKALSDLQKKTMTKQNDQPCTQAMYLKALTSPLYQLSQYGGYQPSFQVTSSAGLTLDSTNMSVVLNTQPPTVIQKAPTQTLTLNIVNTLPIMSPNCSSILNTGKSKNVGKHICAHCGRDCLKPSVLEKHIRSHTGERPFPCTTCGIAFKTQSNLYKHRKTQTHVNNTKLSVDSDAGSYQDDRTSGQDVDNPSRCLSTNQEVIASTVQGQYIQCEISDSCHTTGDIINSSVGNKDIFPTCEKNLKLVQGDPEKTSVDSDNTQPAIVSPTALNQKWMIKDQRSPMTCQKIRLQRQHATYVEKQWDGSPSERKLKKCESTDSGYLSHSDSVDLQFYSGSPLHSLCENSMESDHLLSTGTQKTDATHSTSMDYVDKAASMEKKNLEEHISMLISRNKAVVDDKELDNVRPRKTALSKQGSIDLPMPYTFKDSFHFDIRSLDVNRKKISVCSANSIFTPLEKNKPLFFHSVPTQFSTSVDSIAVSRSNSLPFVDCYKLTPDKVDIQSATPHCLVKQPLDTSFSNLLLTNTVAACTVDFSSSHPRSLVRQAAVDEIHLSTGTDGHIQDEMKKKHTGERNSPRSKTSNRKGGSKKLNMFSHEKWQMYGDETFKKLYQKVQNKESIRKITQEETATKSMVSNENNLPAENDSTNSVESHASPLDATPIGLKCNFQSSLSPQVALEIGNHEPSQKMETHLATSNIHKSSGLEQDAKFKLISGIQGAEMNEQERNNKPLTNRQAESNTEMPYSPNDFPQLVLTGHNIPLCETSDNITIKINNEDNTLSSIPNAEYCHEVCRDNFNRNSEKSHSERKKFKVEELNGNQRNGTQESSNINHNVNIEDQFSGGSSLEPMQKMNVGERKVNHVDGEKCQDNINAVGEDRQSACKDMSKISANSIIFEKNTMTEKHVEQKAHILVQSQSISSSSDSVERMFSPCYLLKLHSGEPSVNVPGYLEVKKDGISDISSDETVLESLNATNLEYENVDRATQHLPICQLEKKQEKYLGDSVQITQPFNLPSDYPLKISLNTAQIPNCASELCSNVDHDKLQDTQGDNDHNDTLAKADISIHSKDNKEILADTPSVAPFLNGLFFIYSAPADCTDQILQPQIACGGIVNPSTSSDIKANAQFPITALSGNLSTEHSHEPLKSACLLHTTNEPKACTLPGNQHTDPLISQEPGYSVQATLYTSLPSGNNAKYANDSNPSLNTGKEHRTHPSRTQTNMHVPPPLIKKEDIFSALSTFHHSTMKNKRPESKHWTEKNNDPSLASMGNLRSVDSSSCYLPQKQKENKGYSVHKHHESSAASPNMKELGTSKTQPSSKRSGRKKTEHKKRHSEGRQNKHSSVGPCKQNDHKNVHSITCHDRTQDITLHDDHQRKSKYTSLEPAAEAPADQNSSLQSKGVSDELIEQGNSSRTENKKEKVHYNEEQLVQRTDAALPMPSQSLLSNNMAHSCLNLSMFTTQAAPQESARNSPCLFPPNKEYSVKKDLKDNIFTQVTPERKQDHPIHAPQQKHARRILHRSKTIGHNLGDHATYGSQSLQTGPSTAQIQYDIASSMPDLMSSLCSASMEGSNTSGPNKTISGKPQEPAVSSCVEQLPIQRTQESINIQSTDYKSEQKLSLETIRKQIHVEYRDTSSDDEDRLVIEI